METFSTRIVNWWRKYRDNYFNKLADPFVKVGISANMMTTFALVCGLLSVYFLFSNYWLFFLFGLLHVLADLLDGLIARRTKLKYFGKFYDNLTDRIIEVLLLAKVAWFVQSPYAYLALGLIALTQIVYALSGMKAPVIFVRGITLLFLALSVPALAILNFPTVTYVVALVAGVYSLFLQVGWYWKKKK